MPSFLRHVGPGVITGAADDDPSGIATYTQAGAQFGTGVLWTVLLTIPFMIGIQLVSARIGRQLGRGIAANLRLHTPRAFVLAIVGLLLIANTVNIAADIAAMGEALQLVVGGGAHFHSMAFGALTLLLQVFVPYRRLAPILKWLTLSLFVYVATAFTVQIPWGRVLHDLVLPQIVPSAAFWMTIVAILGTTISPYLFFWHLAFTLFSLGIIATGLLAVPVLASSAAYAVAEAFGWPEGLERHWREAKGFYAIIGVATIVGTGLDFTPIDPMKALYWSAIVNGVVAVPIMVAMMILSGNAAVMGALPVQRKTRFFGWGAVFVMSVAVVMMIRDLAR